MSLSSSKLWSIGVQPNHRNQLQATKQIWLILILIDIGDCKMPYILCLHFDKPYTLGRLFFVHVLHFLWVCNKELFFSIADYFPDNRGIFTHNSGNCPPDACEVQNGLPVLIPNGEILNFEKQTVSWPRSYWLYIETSSCNSGIPNTL